MFFLLEKKNVCFRNSLYKEQMFCYSTNKNKCSCLENGERIRIMNTHIKRRYRIVSRKRFSAFLLSLVILCTAVLGLVSATQTARGMSETVYTEVLVQTGDTLWELAKEYGPKEQDVRQTVYTICRINEMEAEDLQAGQKILIPNT